MEAQEVNVFDLYDSDDEKIATLERPDTTSKQKEYMCCAHCEAVIFEQNNDFQATIFGLHYLWMGLRNRICYLLHCCSK